MKFFNTPKSEIIKRLKHDFSTAHLSICLDFTERLMAGNKSLYFKYSGDYPIIEEFLEVLGKCEELEFTDYFVDSTIDKGNYIEVLPIPLNENSGFWVTPTLGSVDAKICITEKQFVELINPIIKYII